MKRQIILFAIAITSIAITSCKKELQQVNTNPNTLESPDATTLLSNIIVTEIYNNANVDWTLGNGYDQYMTFSQSYYDQGTRYQPVTNEPYWIALYGAARDASTLYTLGQQKNNNFIQATALTLRSYAFAQLTELWGDIPFSQALQGSKGIYTPSYDGQQSVYTDSQLGILPSLARADSLLKVSSPGAISGDVLYSGNATSWRKFINALRLRYLLRVSAKMDPSSAMQSIVSDGTLMQSAADGAEIKLTASVTPYNFLSLTERSGDFFVKYMNSTLYDVFSTTGDTSRMTAYFAPNANAAQGASFAWANYGGMPMVVDADANQVAQSSNFNSSFQSGSNAVLLKGKIMTYAEQEFILAEAALKGYIPGGSSAAMDYYNSGIEGAFVDAGLSVQTADNYISHATVQFDNSTTDAAMKQIITQKWVSNINNAFEGWIEYRRTGYPDFQTGGSANLNGGVIPSRFLYPTSEATINTSNYNTEVQKMGGTEVTTYKAWWEQ